MSQPSPPAPTTGLVYNEQMASMKCLWDDSYEECPERFTHTLARIKELELDTRCTVFDSRPATKEEVFLVHDEEYFNTIAKSSGLTDEVALEEMSSKFDAVYFHPRTFDMALHAAGAGIDLVTKVVKGEVTNGFACIRPPGHHAMRAEACGYCFFNNIAIAAKHAVANLNVARVLIIDWDVHHGQATQYTFNEDPSVLYVSIHRYENGKFWPELIESNYTSTGIGTGKGFNCNIPLNETGMNDKDYLAIFHNLILPLAYKFDPELVLISAGFDAAIGCPEGEMKVSPATYAHMTRSLMALANGKVCAFLEGGYCIPSLAEGAALTLRSLLGDPCPSILPFSNMRIHKSLLESVLDSIWALRPYWPGTFPLQGEYDQWQEAEGDQECATTVDVLRPRYKPIAIYEGTVAFKEKPESYPTRNCYPVQSIEVKAALETEIEFLKEHTQLSSGHTSSYRTCLAFHELMMKHKGPPDHVERPTRIRSIFNALTASGLAGKCLPVNELRYATDEELQLCHTPEHVQTVKKLKGMSEDAINKLAESLDSIYLTKETNENARLATGLLLNVVDKVLTGVTLNGFAVIRPPGHHASSSEAAGFCIFNNVAIAAKYALKNYSKIVKKVLIVDFDVHHGDGTQKLVQGNTDILYISIHRYDYADFYPSTIISGLKTEHKNILNIPWNSSLMGSTEYLSALVTVVLPVAYEFNPDLVFVSAGFDAAVNDPLGRYSVAPEVYGHWIHHLNCLANGKVVVSLEGGYNLISISNAATQVTSALLGYPPKVSSAKKIDESAIDTLREVVDFNSSRWHCLGFGVDLPPNPLD